MTFRGKTPLWVWLLIPIAVLLALIVAEAVRPKVSGPVPECEECVAERRARKRNLTLLWVTCGVLVVVSLAVVEHAALAVIVTLLLIAVFVWAVIATIRTGRSGLQGTVSKDGLWVTLQVAESHFAAVQQAMQAAGSTTRPA